MDNSVKNSFQAELSNNIMFVQNETIERKWLGGKDKWKFLL